MQRYIIALFIMCAMSVYSVNLARNGAFLLKSGRFNGSQIFFSKYDSGNRVRETQATRIWRQTPYEGWWLQLQQGMEAAVTETPQGLKLSGNGILQGDPRRLSGETATLSFDIMTEHAKGLAALDFILADKVFTERPVAASQTCPLPENTNGQFVRLTLTLQKQGLYDAAMRIRLEAGSCIINRVQLEDGSMATEFQPRPQEWLMLSMDDFAPELFPRYFQASSRKPAQEKHIVLTNISDRPLTGIVNLTLDSWDKAGQTPFATLQLNALPPRGTMTVPVTPGNLSPNTYVVLAQYEADGHCLVAKDIFDAGRTASGTIGQHMLSGYNGLRFAVFRDVEPEEVFGVGNSMINVNQWWSGFKLSSYTMAREAEVNAVLGDAVNEGQYFYTGITGAEVYGNYCVVDNPAARKELNNPAQGGRYLDVFHPDAKAVLQERARSLGKSLALGPGINGVKLGNEIHYINKGVFCPTKYADAAFRAWCRKRHGNLETLNQRWHTAYQSWDEVDQVTSARLAEANLGEAKTGAAAVNWYAQMGNFNATVVAEMAKCPGKAMDWNLWRTESSVEFFSWFHDEVKAIAPRPYLGINLCWPNFWPHFSMALWRNTGCPMLDLQYAAGHGIDLGNSDEMLDILEMAESTAAGKPVWGIEVYVQPSFPADFPALQNWAMVAHGMTNNLVFAWLPYSDHGPSAYASGPRSWEKPGAYPMWFIIDTDGTKLPQYDSNLKSTREIKAFHEAYDGLSLKRLKSRIGWYISDETAEYVIYSTKNQPYQSRLTGAHVAPAALLRMQGVTMDYLDNQAFLERPLDSLDTLILPPTPVLSQDVARRIADFAHQGGTVVLLGPTGVFDPWLNRYGTFGGDAWRDLQWQTPTAWATPQAFMKDFEQPVVQGLCRCLQYDGHATSAWGRGRLIAPSQYVYRYSPKNHTVPELAHAIHDIITEAKLPISAVWQPAADEKTTFDARIGQGTPIVEVVCRKKSAQESFAFVLNQGGAGSGTVLLAGRWNVTDALTGDTIAYSHQDTQTQIPLALAPWGYRVFRLQRFEP